MQSAPRGPRPLSGEISSHPRRLSARKTSNSDSKGFLSRKLSKQQQTPDHRPQRQDADSARQSTASADPGGKGKGKEVEEPDDEITLVRPQFPFKSVVPDQLAELPSWYAKDIETAAVSAAQFRTKYPIHNSRGPRWYRNHHLAPPSREKRPPSVFSPSFPPMATGQERSQDPTKLPGPSRTPSGSPLPTPSSSQVRIHDVRVRTRKLSNTAHDNVDMMDVSDPWGTNWHHQSPYDLGASGERSPDAPEPPSMPRPRRLSMTHGPRHKTLARSPLSQSTSAVHLTSEPLTTGHLPRRLSKKRKPFRGLFSSDGASDTWRIGSSAPVTPVEFGQALGRKISKTGSLIAASIAPSINSQTPTERRMKRGSVLGRLARRFSVLKRSSSTKSTSNGVQSSRVSVDMTYDRSAGLPYQVERRSVSPQKQAQESPSDRSKPDTQHKRVPIPSQADTSSVKSPGASSQQEQDSEARSVTSVEELTQGRLTVANPDDSFNSEDTPQTEPPSSVSPIDNRNDRHVLDEELRESPTPMDSLHLIPRAPLSVISEGETYMSSPKAPPALTPHLVPMSPPTIPSSLSLPLRKPPPSETAPPPVERAPVAPSKYEHSLPPTPVGSRPPTPPRDEPARFYVPATQKSNEIQALTSPSLPSIRGSSLNYADSTPLSRVSMIVNPPTPQPVTLTSLPISPPPKPPTILPSISISSTRATVSPPQDQPHTEKAPSRESSPTKKDKEGHQRSRSRRTETFKLVRTSSGHVQTVDGVVVDAEGEHWQVVESPKDENHKKRHERTKPSESDVPKRTESRRAEKEGASEDSDQQRKHEVRRKSYREPNSSESATTTSNLPRTSSPEAHPSRSEKPDRRRSTREAREARESPTEAVRSTQTPLMHTNPTSAKHVSPNGTAHGSRAERHVSTSTRPSSELRADINALKAADAWELERMWKGRSMTYGTDGTVLPGTRHNITSDSRPSTIMSADLHRASSIPSIDHVSNVGNNQTQTYVMYQAPHGASARTTSAQALYPSIMQQIKPPKDDRRHRSRSMNDSVAAPKSSSPTQFTSIRSNPLPEPPRLSSYKPSPIPPSLGGNGDASSSSEYWMKLAGVTVSH